MDNKVEKLKLEGYDELLYDIKSLLEKAKYYAYKAVDNLRVQTYWQIGERILREELQHKERADYGKRVIEMLAIDLGLARRTMFEIVQFYRAYPIVHTLSAQLSWSHYTTLISITDKKKRQFYEQQAIHSIWSVRELRNQIKDGLYEKTQNEGKLVTAASLPLEPTTPEKAFKDSYSFDFLALPEKYSEKDLENGLLSKTEQLLLEFGTDFALLARQKPIIIDGEYHRVDLELYHRGIPCIILVDLKIGKFKADYVGQMNKYLNYYRENRKYEWEFDPIGLIICEYKGKEEVHYALGSLSNKIFVAEYKAKLPPEEEIKKRLKKIK
ncbi:MAG: hypothetical protein A7316_00615 [Candidatus Altiarchaeales archaeon WOR_SM1_86-2]|nr:MAG: hypothetical protein A7316_00615 [Candidatus Altiarchaeales archaeon WOR_SM1_86-2]ODS41781.1 MAG: hypothetical protein A7315_00260 [Candidatus Altiarchaeales archaeon WOR_SM1_79]